MFSPRLPLIPGVNSALLEGIISIPFEFQQVMILKTSRAVGAMSQPGDLKNITDSDRSTKKSITKNKKSTSAAKTILNGPG